MACSLSWLFNRMSPKMLMALPTSFFITCNTCQKHHDTATIHKKTNTVETHCNIFSVLKVAKHPTVTTQGTQCQQFVAARTAAASVAAHNDSAMMMEHDPGAYHLNGVHSCSWVGLGPN
jgi:hypothetical protein